MLTSVPFCNLLPWISSDLGSKIQIPIGIVDTDLQFDLGLGFRAGIVKSIRQSHQNRSRSIGMWSFRGYFDDMKHTVDPTDPTPINWGMFGAPFALGHFGSVGDFVDLLGLSSDAACCMQIPQHFKMLKWGGPGPILAGFETPF